MAGVFIWGPSPVYKCNPIDIDQRAGHRFQSY
jgi:hypothetical protein